jgi:hypothetical protein
MAATDPLKALRTRLIAAALTVLIAGVAASLVAHRFLGAALGLILSAAILSVAFVVIKRRSILPITVVADLGLIFLATWVDHSWVSALYSAALAALTIPVLAFSAKKLSSDPSLSEDALSALKIAGISVAQNVDGWTAATTQSSVLMIREISPGYGAPASWATPSRHYNQLRPILERAKEAGPAPSVLFVTDAPDPGVLYRGPHYSVVSLGRLGEYLRSASPKKSKQARTNSPQRVRHEGRVTRKVN